MKTRKAEMRREYLFDYRTAVRGKHVGRILAEGANVVVLDVDVAEQFPDSAAVNAALRSLIKRTAPVRRQVRKTNGRKKHAA
jgi:hypothetical protein